VSWVQFTNGLRDDIDTIVWHGCDLEIWICVRLTLIYAQPSYNRRLFNISHYFCRPTYLSHARYSFTRQLCVKSSVQE
jgi:hypothetical protein